jgi:hypothetical protein
VAHDDVHSVEGYHRSLHTLESIKDHPVLPGREGEPSPTTKPAYPGTSTVRLAGPASARVTARSSTTVPPVSLPSASDTDVPLAFDDHVVAPAPTIPHGPMRRDKAMLTINHRPRRLAAPAMALAAVSVLIVVLLLTGSHTVAPTRHHHTGSTTGRATSPATHPPPTSSTTTTPTAPSTAPPPAVSSPQQSTPRGATYDVTGNAFTLSLTATSAPCWVDVTNGASGTMAFEGTLEPGAKQSLAVSAPVTVVVGAPAALGASVNGAAVALPPGFQTPFTMNFVVPAPSG